MLQDSLGTTGQVGLAPQREAAEAVYLSRLQFIEDLAIRLARRNHLSREDAEEFASILKMRLWENGCEKIRQFQGKSKIETYLQTIAVNLLKDFRNQRWGKWRPSSEAVRLGKVAVKLDELTSRDGHRFDEACEILLTNHRVGLSREELRAIWIRLPSRSPRGVEGEEALLNLSASTDRPEGNILEDELAIARSRVNVVLEEALHALPAEDRLLIKMHVLDGWKVVDIARVLGLRQKPLYRRIESICKSLRKRLEDKDVHWAQVKELLNRDDVRW